MKPIAIFCIFALYFQATVALTCKKCGDTGICKSFDEEGTTTTCKDGVMTCVHSFLTDKNGTRMILKDCLDMQKYIRMVGCVRVKNTGMDDHSCFCDTDDCNKDYCDAEHCDCAYADPDKCVDPVDPTQALKCYTCDGACKNGDPGQLTTCDHGEKSCLYGKVSFGTGNNKTNMVIKACDPDSKVMKTGCLDSHSDHYFDGGSGFDGNFCYCADEGCNQNWCDPNDCSCKFANHDQCGNSANVVSPIMSIVITAIFTLLLPFWQ